MSDLRVHSSWHQDPSGRPFRTVSVNGIYYTQWDNERGGLSPNPATPRTPNPQNANYHAAISQAQLRNYQQPNTGYPQQDPVYHNPLFPTTTTSSTIAPVSPTRQFEHSYQNSQQPGSYPQQNLYQNENNVGGHVAAPNTGLPHSGRSIVNAEADGGGGGTGALTRSRPSESSSNARGAEDERHEHPSGGTHRSPTSTRPWGTQHSPTHKPSLSSDIKSPKNPGVIRAGSKYNDEALDRRFIERKGKTMERFFQPGRVFAMLWHENAGTSNGTELSTRASQDHYSKGRHDSIIHSKKRFMVVVKALHGSSWCSPIQTYSGQGVTKSGLSTEDIENHAVIYMQGTWSRPHDNEVGIVKEPIEVAPAGNDQRLDPMSRLNFGKIYTVEHYIKAMDVGMVTNRSKPYLSLYFMNVCKKGLTAPPVNTF